MKIFVAYEGDIEFTSVIYVGIDLDEAKSIQKREYLDYWIDIWEEGKIIGHYMYIEEDDMFIYESK